jgi:nucleoprotein TPR
LSPAAAAASKLLKTGMSLTQVYSQLVSCQEELLTAEDEKRRLNTYLEQILCDIEQRAPALKRQRLVK